MILFDAFTTKSLHVCLPFSFKLIDPVLRDREDSVKKKFLQADFVELYFLSSLSLILVGFHRCGSSLSFLSHAVGFTRLLPDALHIVVHYCILLMLSKSEITVSSPCNCPCPPPPGWMVVCVGLQLV